jgi:uncharacterized protein (DUF1800 family)
MDPKLRALNRFGLGARVGERDRMSDPRAWLRAQLNGGAPLRPAPDVASPAAIGDALRAFRMPGREDKADRQEARRRLVAIASAEGREALIARATSARPFVERLVAFWSNHLCVSAAGKVLVAPLAGAYEREVIRPHVLGRFEEMVLASAKHPAMLFYLDNFQSIGPSSRGARAGRRNAARRGLNENYARELLELHTLGVNGGYTQKDVQELAKILTGWTVDGLGGPRRARRASAGMFDANGPVQFAFHDLLHEPGSKTVLGVRYGDDGVAEGEEAIRNLCRHPSTAQFIARKLATHFVADDPPQGAVTRLARAFQESKGDLNVVAAALIDTPEAWTNEARKFRTPQDWLIAVLRAFQATDVGDNVGPVLRQLRHPLWSPAAPKGFGDSMQEWSDPDSLLNRAELARTVARRIGGRSVDPKALATAVDVAPRDPLHGFLADTSIPAGERVALAIAGPVFQWR